MYTLVVDSEISPPCASIMRSNASTTSAVVIVVCAAAPRISLVNGSLKQHR